MKKLFISIILLPVLFSCKKDNQPEEKKEEPVQKEDIYTGKYNVYEKSSIRPNPNSSFISEIKTETASDTSFLIFYQVERTDKPWGALESLKYRLVGTDSLAFDTQAILKKGGNIFGNNDSIIINFSYGVFATVYDIEQTWVKIK